MSEDTKKRLPIAVGIDLGTTNSCVGWWDSKKGAVEILPNEFGHRTTPSYVTITSDARIVGQQSQKMQIKYPEQTIYESKRFIGRKFSELTESSKGKSRPFPYKIVDLGDDVPQFYIKTDESDTGEKLFYPQEIGSFILDKMKKIAENVIGEPVKRAVITVPAYFNDAQRQATRDAGYIAQLEVLRIINEPTAAALAYGLDKKTQEKDINVLVFDLGGGTLDTSLLCISGDGIFEVLSTAGDTYLGGADFDQELMNLILELAHIPQDQVYSNTTSVRKLRNAAEQAKCELSSMHTTTIDIELGSNNVSIDITRRQFENRVEHLFTRCMNCVKQTLADVNFSPTLIDDVVLVGGSTRIPKIQELLSEYFRNPTTLEPKKLCKSINPDEAVAYGAAIQAALLNYSDENDETDENEYEEENLPDILLRDVCPLSLGIETVGGLMTTIIPRNTTIPIAKTKLFSTLEDNQTAVTVSVFEGERSETKHNRLLGEFELCGIKEAPRGDPKIEVTFEVDSDGIFTVGARDISQIECGGESGSYQRLHINHTTQRDSKNIEALIDAAKNYEQQDEAFRKLVRVKTQYENFIYYIRDLMTKDERLKTHLNKQEKELIEQRVLSEFEWLKTEGRDEIDIKVYEDRLIKASEFVKPLIEEVNSRIQSLIK